MAIYPDKKDGVATGRWRVEVQARGLRKRGRFDTHTAAKQAEKVWKHEMANENMAPGVIDRIGAVPRQDPRMAPRTIVQLATKAAPMLWNQSDHGQLSETKVKQVAEWLGDIPLRELRTGYIDDAVIRLREEGRSPATINRYLAALHAVIAWGTKRGYVPSMPEFSWQDEDEGRIRYLTQDEEDKVVLTLRALELDVIADFVIAAVDTGCRRGELLGARPDQLDGNWLRLWVTKNGKSRSVPLTARAKAILKRRLPWALTEAQLRYGWNKAKTAMGLGADEDFVVHALRHTCATRLVGLGVNLRVIQMYMGHKAIQTTLRYAHVSDDMLTEAALKMARGHIPPASNGVGENEGTSSPVNPPPPRDAHTGVLEAVE